MRQKYKLVRTRMGKQRVTILYIKNPWWIRKRWRAVNLDISDAPVSERVLFWMNTFNIPKIEYLIEQ